jgi:hypothetical protein
MSEWRDVMCMTWNWFISPSLAVRYPNWADKVRHSVDLLHIYQDIMAAYIGQYSALLNNYILYLIHEYNPNIICCISILREVQDVMAGEHIHAGGKTADWRTFFSATKYKYRWTQYNHRLIVCFLVQTYLAKLVSHLYSVFSNPNDVFCVT